MTVPIIIINWNGITDTIECIESLLKMSYTNYHIYLIDNGSDNQEGYILSQNYADLDSLSVIRYDENFGFTKAHLKIWDDMLNKTEAPYIALLNNDTAVEPDWLEELLNFADVRKVDIVSSKMIDYTHRDLMDNAGHRMLNTGEIIPIGFSQPIADYTKPIENVGACAGACLYRTEMLQEIGFFDPYFTTGYEDAEFGLRATISGYLCMYCPEAIVYHKRGASIKKVFNRDYSIMIQTSILYSYFKLVPTKNIVLSVPSIIFKNISIPVIDILFQRWSYLYIWRKSWIEVFTIRKLILAKRKQFKRQIESRIGLWEFSTKTKFFLSFDLSRFWNIIILKKHSSLDSY